MENNTDSSRFKFYKSPACIIYLLAYVLFMCGDIHYLVRWAWYGETESALALFIPLAAFHQLFLILTIIWVKKKKVPFGAYIILVILVLVAGYALMTAHSMVAYVYKSRNGTYDKTIDDFKNNATMNVTSESIASGRWTNDITNTSEGLNLSPQLSFDPVDGASYYVIYMVDESANNWVHWYAEVTDTELEEGLNPGQYIGPYPPEGSGDHLYTVYVYALAGRPGVVYDGEYPEFDESWFGGDELWAGVLNKKDASRSPALYGNVLGYGYVSGTYSR
ncbi:MAG: hypothetical protein K5871_02465 [Lachnospiraceae bacterium]|nr:hypothetical protein [Lachnospiraceae bacterium]